MFKPRMRLPGWIGVESTVSRLTALSEVSQLVVGDKDPRYCVTHRRSFILSCESSFLNSFHVKVAELKFTSES